MYMMGVNSLMALSFLCLVVLTVLLMYCLVEKAAIFLYFYANILPFWLLGF